MTSRTALSRLAGVILSAGLILIGIAIATRPVGDERLRQHATARSWGVIQQIDGTTWYGTQKVVVAWFVSPSGEGQQIISELDLEAAVPAWAPGGQLQLAYDPAHPRIGAVVADPYWTFNSDYRITAGFESAVPFALALYALALFVIWPAKRSHSFPESALRRSRRSLVAYCAVPAVVSVAALALPMSVQDISAYSPNIDNWSGPLSMCAALLPVWALVRVVRRNRLLRLLTHPADPVDRDALIQSVAGRRFHVDARVATGHSAEPRLVSYSMRVLAGQGKPYSASDRIALFGRTKDRGPALISDGERNAVIGFARRHSARTWEARPDLRGQDKGDRPPLAPRNPSLRNTLRLNLAGTAAITILVCAGSIYLIRLGAVQYHLANAATGGNKAGKQWDAVGWLAGGVLCVFVIWFGVSVYRGRALTRLLGGEHVARAGVVVGTANSAIRTVLGTTTARIDLIAAARPGLKVRCIGGQRVRWLTSDQAVVVMDRGKGTIRAAVIVGPDGRAALATAREHGPFRLALANGAHAIQFMARLKPTGGEVLSHAGSTVAVVERTGNKEYAIDAGGMRWRYVARTTGTHTGFTCTGDKGMIVRGSIEPGDVTVTYLDRRLHGSTALRQVALADEELGVVVAIDADKVMVSSELQAPHLPVLVAVALLALTPLSNR